MKTKLRLLIGTAVGLVVAGCGGQDLSYKEDKPVIQSGPKREQYDPDDTVFGPDGISIRSLASGTAFGDNEAGSALPVNKYLWQASLDTLSFLPLASTDPFTGVIATDWGATPNQPGERFKVTAYMLSPELSASSLKVAVYRETRSEDGLWVPATVDPDTARKIEDAILTRARQIRIAQVGEGATG